MYIIKCDRCGKEKVLKNLIPTYSLNPEKPTVIPKYSIMKMVAEMQTITLCEECEAEFEHWLNRGVEEDSET